MIDEKFLKDAVERALEKRGVTVEKRQVNEALVAQVKSYPMAAESVSSQTKKQHTELYNGYVESYNRVSARLDALQPDSSGSGSSDFRSLKQDETYLRNAVYLHELYFANSFDPKSEIYSDMLACMRLERDFGTFEAWQQCFVDCALAAREGWAVCGYDMYSRRYVNFFVDGHDCGVPIGVVPVLVIDVWNHASKDGGNDRKSYVISQMREINWTVVDDRVQRCERAENAS